MGVFDEYKEFWIKRIKKIIIIFYITYEIIIYNIY